MNELARNHTATDHVKPVASAPAQTAAARPETKGDAKLDTKGDAKDRVKGEAAGETTPDAKADQKNDGRDGEKGQEKVDAKGEEKADTKGGEKADAKGGEKTDTKGGEKTDDKADPKDGEKRDGKADATPVLALGSQAREVVSQVATQVATQAKELVTSRVAEQTDRGAGDLGDVAKALRHTSRQLDGNIASPLVDKAADQLERASEFLQTANPGQMAQAVQSFARREPLLFLGGAFAAGIVLARFLKSSGHRDDDTSDEEHDASSEEHDAAPVEAAAPVPVPQRTTHSQKRHGRKHRKH